MPKYTYTGPEIDFVLRGVHFPNGDEVEIDDAAFEAKLDNLPYFTSDKPKPKATTVVALRDQEIEGYQRKIAGLEAENALLRKQLSEQTPDEPETEPYTIFEEEVSAPEEELATYTPGKAEAPVEEPIPDDWRDMHWKRLQLLARKFTDMEIKDKEDAVTAIELELERRDQNAG